MQIANKIKIVIFVMLLIITNIFTYKLTSEKVKFDMFLSEINYNSILFSLLDENDTKKAKTLLQYDIQRVLYEAEKSKNIDLFIPICRDITQNTLKLYSINRDNNISTLEYKEMSKVLKIGQEKIFNLCSQFKLHAKNKRNKKANGSGNNDNSTKPLSQNPL